MVVQAELGKALSENAGGRVASKKFLNHIHYFRGLAVICMAIVHLWIVPQQYEKVSGTEFIDVTREALFHDTTMFFIFISGFLFKYLSSNFEIKKYYRSKLSNVISPYAFLTVTAFLGNYLFFHSYHQSSLHDLLKKAVAELVYGTIQEQFWYIPFISLVFLISPLLLKIPKDQFKIVALLAFFLPLLGTRSETAISIGQYLYFFPIYLFGMYAATDYSKFIELIKQNIFLLVAVTVITTIIIVIVELKYYHPGLDFHYYILSEYIGVATLHSDFLESLYYLQKISMCLLLVVFLMRFDDRKYPLLEKFATYSFAIYFMHTFVGNRFVLSYYYSIAVKLPFLLIPLSILYITSVIFATLLVCMLLKKIIGTRSRYFIGS